jgi:hypothetical protein
MSNNASMIHQVEEQAYRYGAQVRLLENRGIDQDRLNIRLAYMRFVQQLRGSGLDVFAYRSYAKSYCR